MAGDDSDPESENEPIFRAGPFFLASHWARMLLMALLAITAAGTMGQAIWQLTQPNSQALGEFVEVTETGANDASVIYNLVLRNERGELEFIRLRNNGRILNYLLTQRDVVKQRVAVQQSRDVAQRIELLDGVNQTVRESKLSAPVQLLIGGMSLIILVLHIRPR